MEAYKQEFVDFMLDCGVLKFGDFTLKSGRRSPFFMNAGLYVTGSQLTKLGEYYAKAIHDKYGDDFDVLFGPAYKGIPLSVATTMAYSRLYGKEIRYCSNRKEAKDHGDAGILPDAVYTDGDYSDLFLCSVYRCDQGTDRPDDAEKRFLGAECGIGTVGLKRRNDFERRKEE